MKHKWVRVSKDFVCEQCKHKDWCTFCPELMLVCCMRTSSPRPCKNGGWIHDMGAKPKFIPKPKPEPPSINTTRLMAEWTAATPEAVLVKFADSLGVSYESLQCANCAWSETHRAFAFTMFDGYGSPCGIRLRNWAGEKWSVTGSRSGLFIPHMPAQRKAFIVEGPTDVAACLTLGVFPIGRPSCLGCEQALNTALRRLRVERAVILVDNDGPGIAGAQELSAALRLPHVMLILPCKDIRESVQFGMTRELLESMTTNLTWIHPT